MTDLVIVLISSTSLITFIIALTFVIRRFGQAGILTWLKRIFLIISCLSGIIVWLASHDFSVGLRIQLLFIHLVLNWLLCFAYIDGLFGLPLTSLRIQVLLTLVGSGKAGIKKSILKHRYSIASITRQRLYRLETSGEIIRRGSVYAIRSAWSYFMFHTYFLILLLFLYRPIKSKQNV